MSALVHYWAEAMRSAWTNHGPRFFVPNWYDVLLVFPLYPIGLLCVMLDGGWDGRNVAGCTCEGGWETGCTCEGGWEE